VVPVLPIVTIARRHHVRLALVVPNALAVQNVVAVPVAGLGGLALAKVALEVRALVDNVLVAPDRVGLVLDSTVPDSTVPENAEVAPFARTTDHAMTRVAHVGHVRALIEHR